MLFMRRILRKWDRNNFQAQDEDVDREPIFLVKEQKVELLGMITNSRI